MTRTADLNLDPASGFLCPTRRQVLAALVVRGHTLDYEEVKSVCVRIMGHSACFTHSRLTLHYHIRYGRSSSESRVAIGPVVQHQRGGVDRTYRFVWMSTCSLSLSDRLTILAWSFERSAVILISRFVAQPSDTTRHESVSFRR
jgi:hypothetical protein